MNVHSRHTPPRFKTLTRLFHQSIASLNITSLSQYNHYINTTSEQKARFRMVIDVLHSLCSMALIVCLQETHLGEHEQNALKGIFPHYHIYYNNHDHNSAGTLIMIHDSADKHYQILELTLDPAAKGRVQGVRLTPQEGQTHEPFQLLNVYLPHDDLGKIECFKAMVNLPFDDRTAIIGDWNFIESPKDATNPNTNLLITGAAKDAWEILVDRYQLREIRQPTHTHYFIASDPALTRTSRIDRAYISTDQAADDATVPTLHIPHTPHSVLKAHNTNNRNKSLTDHTPLLLSFHPHGPTQQRKPRIFHPWMADVNSITEYIGRNINSTLHSSHDPFHALSRFTELAHTGAKRYWRSIKDKKVGFTNDLHELTIATKLYRLCSAVHPDADQITALVSRYPSINKHVNPTTNPHGVSVYDLSALARRIDELTQATTDPTNLTNLPPSTTPAAQQHNRDLFDEVQEASWDFKARLRAVRPSMEDNPTDDPKEMANVILPFWKEVWSKRSDPPSRTQTRNYLADYPKRVPETLLPKMPSQDDIVDGILKTTNTASGPDGIPFALIRRFAHELAPILLRCIEELGAGRSPPPAFNAGHLHLFPKNDSQLVQDLRPITVGNAFNRIVAKLLVFAITPALQQLLSPSQKGFVPGRDGADSIETITEQYYSALLRKHQQFILFLDTRKAFDSLDHRFIQETLRHVGMPTWLCNAVVGLMSDVKITPMIFLCRAKIAIERGVKQGCPLSPLLFVLAYDVLLHRLSSNKDLRHYAFADDLAVESQNIGHIRSALRTITRYSRISGLGINIHKTSILSTMPVTDWDRAVLGTDYRNIKFVDAATYLGVPIGRFLTLEDVFAKPLDKFLERLRKLRRLLKRYSLHKRILVANIYLLPLFLYLARFYTIPYSIIVRVRRALHTAIVAFHGTAFSYPHLISKAFGPHTPLKDLWATNMALLATGAIDASNHGRMTPDISAAPQVTSPHWSSMLIKENRQSAVFVYLEDYNDRADDLSIRIDHLSERLPRQRAQIYEELVRNGYWRERTSQQASYKGSLYHKAHKHIDAPIHPSIHDPASHLESLAPLRRVAGSNPWNTFLKLTMNALATDCRRHKAGIEVPQRGPPANPFPCYFCGQDRDHVTHMYSECSVTGEALHRVSTAAGAGFTHTLTDSLTLALPRDNTHILYRIAFNWAVWRTRQDFLITRTHPPPPEQTVNRITTMALNHALAAGKTASKSRAYNPRVLSMARAPQADRLICFTDGSAMPNPGPTGAGVHYHLPATGAEHSITIALGEGDNNLGEIVGLGIAISISTLYQDDTALIFSDSLSSIYYLTAGWPHPADKRISRATRRTYRNIAPAKRPRLYWVRGHANIDGNEHADKYAKRGAAISKAGRHNYPYVRYSINTPPHIKLVVDDFLNYMYDSLPP